MNLESMRNYDENNDDEIVIGKYNQKKRPNDINTYEDDNLDEILAYDYPGKKKPNNYKETNLMTPKKNKQKQMEEGRKKTYKFNNFL